MQAMKVDRQDRVRQILVAISTFVAMAIGLLPTTPAAEEGAAAPTAAAKVAAEARPTAETDGATPEAWWAHSRKKFFKGIDLSPEQDRQIDALIKDQVEGRYRYERLAKEVAAARKRGDDEAARILLRELKRQRMELRLRRRLDAMKEILTDSQQRQFDENRRKLRPKSQAARPNRP